jgi:hypothetical protein
MFVGPNGPSAVAAELVRDEREVDRPADRSPPSASLTRRLDTRARRRGQ